MDKWNGFEEQCQTSRNGKAKEIFYGRQESKRVREKDRTNNNFIFFHLCNDNYMKLHTEKIAINAKPQNELLK